MQLTLHAIHPTPYVASRLMQAMSAWSVKAGRAPSLHCRYARVYGHTTTAMHDNDNEYTPRSPFFARCVLCLQAGKEVEAISGADATLLEQAVAKLAES